MPARETRKSQEIRPNKNLSTGKDQKKAACRGDCVNNWHLRMYSAHFATDRLPWLINATMNTAQLQRSFKNAACEQI